MEKISKVYTTIFVIALFVCGAFANDVFIYQGQYRGSAGRGDLPFNLSNPTALVIGDDGILYVGDSMLGAVYGINLSTDKVVKMIGKTGGASSFTTITDVQYVNKKIYASDRSSNKIYEYIEGSGLYEVGPVSGIVFAPTAFKIENETIWILNSENDRVIQYDIQRKDVIAQYLQSGIGTGRIKGALDFDMDEKYVYIADTQNDRIEVFTKDMKYYATVGAGKGGVAITQPKSVAVDEQGRIFVADSTSKIIVFDINSNVLATFGEKGNGTNQFNNPTKLRFADNQTLYVADSSNKRVIAFTFNWSAGKQQILAQIDQSNKTVQDYKENIIEVMNKLSVEHLTFSAQNDMKIAYEMYDKNEFGEAKKYALKATQSISDRTKNDEQLLDVKLKAMNSNISFALEYYQTKLSLDDEKKRADYLSMLDQSKTYVQDKQYLQASEIAIKITKWLEDIEAKYKTEQQNQNEQNPIVIPQNNANEKLTLIKNQGANLQIQLEKLQTKAKEFEVVASFETIQTLIQTSDSLAQMNAYEEAQNSLNNAKSAIETIEQTVNSKEQEVLNARLHIEGVYQKLEAIGISKDSQNEFALQVAHAYEISAQSPQEAKEIATNALLEAQTQNQGQSGLAITVAAFFGAFVAVILVGAMVAFYIMKRNPRNKQNGLADVKIEFAKKDEDKNSKDFKRK